MIIPRDDCAYLSTRAVANKEWSVKPMKAPVPGKLVPVGFAPFTVRSIPHRKLTEPVPEAYVAGSPFSGR